MCHKTKESTLARYQRNISAEKGCRSRYGIFYYTDCSFISFAITKTPGRVTRFVGVGAQL